MKHEAPPILGPLEFEGMENKLILIEKDETPTLVLLDSLTSGKNNLIFTEGQMPKRGRNFQSETSWIVPTNTISQVYRILKELSKVEGSAVDFIMIDELETFNATMDRKTRGSQLKAFICMMCSKQILRGANLIVTSQKEEYMLRELADYTYNLR